LPNICTALPAHRPAADDNPLIGCTSHNLTADWSQPAFISLTACAHLAARLGAFYYRTRFNYLTTMYRSTIPLRFIWKLGLWLALDLKWHYF